MKKQIIIYLLILLLSSGCAFEIKDNKNNTIQSKDNNIIDKVVEDRPVREEDPMWPTNDFTNNILKFEYGDNQKIHTNDNTGFVIEYNNVLIDDFNQYIKNIKNLGYNLNILEINEETSKSYTADNEIYQVTLTYLEGNVSLSMIKLELGN